MTRSASYEVRVCRASDKAALIALHDRSWGGSLSERFWTWRFEDNPCGVIEGCAAFDQDGACWAASTAISLRFWLAGQELLAMDHHDVVVDPKLRGSLLGSRLVLQVWEALVAARCVGRVELQWGFPHPALRRLVVGRAHCEVLSDLVILLHELSDDIAKPAEIDVRVVRRFDERADGLWSSQCENLEAAIIRDARYLNWCFADHPERRFQLLEAVDDRGSLRGIAVVRSGGLHDAVLTLADWLVPHADVAAAAALLGYCVGEARRRGASGLAAYFPTMSTEFRHLQSRFGFVARSLPKQQIFRSWNSKLSRDWLFEHLYQTAGDIDFV